MKNDRLLYRCTYRSCVVVLNTEFLQKDLTVYTSFNLSQHCLLLKLKGFFFIIETISHEKADQGCLLSLSLSLPR